MNNDGTNSVFELNILQEFCRRKPRKNHHNVNLLTPDFAFSQQIYFRIERYIDNDI